MQSIREKVALHGMSVLGECEILALLLEDKHLAEKVLEECGSLSAIAKTAPSRLRMVAGLGARLAERVAAAAEMGRRIVMANEVVEDKIASSDDVVRIMRPLLKTLKHEECWVLYLTNSGRIIERNCISRGGVQATIVDPMLIAKRAVELVTPRIIVVHNHPSGSATPSGADVDITRRLKEVTTLLNIQLLDHIIISDTEHYSFKSSGKL